LSGFVGGRQARAASICGGGPVENYVLREKVRQALRLDMRSSSALPKAKSTNGNTNDRQDEKQRHDSEVARLKLCR
jgi:hypothetical protein